MATENIKKLKYEWYKKLQESGFTDIEDENGNIKEIRSRVGGGNSVVSYTEYYEIATHYGINGRFDNEFESRVWQYFCDGLSVRKIAKAMDSYKKKVDIAIQKHKKLAGIYRWKK